MVRHSCASHLDSTFLKNQLWPTPNLFPKNEDIVYRALNRLTDESDEVDRQIQANVLLACKSSGVCSTDDINESANEMSEEIPASNTKVIETLPLPRSTRSSIKNQQTVIAPAKN